MTGNLGEYLGVPIFNNRAGINTFKFVVEKVKQRLSNWKARTLSFAGRVTLAKSVVQAMPTYAMQSSMIPKTTCDEVDTLCKSFIWGDEDNHRKIHLVNWEKMLKPKVEGGLGMRSTRKANEAFMLKGLWQFYLEPNKLWCRILRNIYKCGEQDILIIYPKRKGSNFWNGLGHSLEEFRRNLHWTTGNGDSILFRFDNWVADCEPLHSYCLTDIP